MITNHLNNSVVVSRPSNLSLPLKVGQVVLAKIIKVTGTKALISFGGREMPAQLETELIANTVVPLQVKELAQGKIVLSLLNTDSFNLETKLDETTLKLARILIMAGQELRPESFRGLQNLFSTTPLDSESMKAAALILKYAIPLTPENLTIFRMFISNDLDLAQYFQAGFNPLKSELPLANELQRVLQSSLLALLRQEKGLQDPAGYFTALKVFHSAQGHYPALSPLLALFIPVFIQGKVYNARVDVEGKAAKSGRSSTIRLTFNLETNTLGKVQIELTLLDKALDFRITANEKGQEVISTHVDEFKEKLRNLGFSTRSFLVTKLTLDEDISRIGTSEPIPLDLRL